LQRLEDQFKNTKTQEFNTMNQQKQYALAAQFIGIVIASTETLGGVADQYGPQTLADVIYLQAAIADNEFIDEIGESQIMDFIKTLPYSTLWLSYIRPVEGAHNPYWDKSRDDAKKVDAESPLKIVIEVEQGIIQGVVASMPVQYLVYDKDVQGGEFTSRPALDGLGMVDVFDGPVWKGTYDTAAVETAFKAAPL
jgi:hypothetical protein